jgi:hypothetical protein
MYWLKEWGAISALWVVPLTLIGMVITLAIFAANQQSTIVNKLDSINTHLNTIDGQLAKQAVVTQSSLSPVDFNAALPDLSSAISTMRREKLDVSSGIVGSLQTKLLAANKQAPGYWSAATQLVNYKFQMQFPSALPNCLDQVMNHTVDVDGNTGHQVSPNAYPTSELRTEVWDVGHCALDLDADGKFSSTALGKAMEQEKKKYPNLSYFILRVGNARISYFGGKPLPFTAIEFQNCAFELNPPGTQPTKEDQSITTQLLTSDTSGKLYLPSA